MKKDTLTDSEIVARQHRGWLTPYLLGLSDMFDNRWDYWLASCQKGSPLDTPIPKIDFCDSPNLEAMKNTLGCIERAQGQGHSQAFWKFCDWLLWGFNAPDSIINKPPDLPDGVLAFWYKKFNLGLWIQSPYDYLGEIAAEIYNAGKNPSGYYPTPMAVCKGMADIILPEELDITASVLDPCIGSGRLLMVASNFSLNLYGCDIDFNILKICRINMICFVPWAIARPDNFEMIKGFSSNQPILHVTPEIQQALLKQAGISSKPTIKRPNLKSLNNKEK